MPKQGRSVWRLSRAAPAALLIATLGFPPGSPGAPLSQPPLGAPGIRSVVSRAAVINFLELAREEAAKPKLRPAPRRVIPFMRGPTEFPVPTDASLPPAFRAAPKPGPGFPALVSPSPGLSFEALGDDSTHIPPDTQGAVGVNHLMVTLNSEIRIQNRFGAELSKMTLESFWTSTSATGVFDPKLTYDPFNNRWIFVAVSDRQSASSSLLIAASQTDDPTGNWNLFRVDADSTDTVWADFPSLGFTKDWAVVTLNMFNVSNNGFARVDIYAFNKANLYSNTSASNTRFSTTGGFTLAPAVTYDNSLATAYLVQNFNGNSMGNGFVEISTITGSVGSEVFTQGTTLVSTANPWGCAAPGNLDFAPQKDISNKIHANDCRILSVVYRNAALWATQTAFLPAAGSTRSAVQWWQFLPNGTVQQFGRVDDSSGVNFYAFPSLAVNSQNDVLLGYACFSANIFASGCYSFRASTDTASTLRDPVLLKAGEATYSRNFGGPDNRWGDYSATVVDPANDLDFWTIQEYAVSPPYSYMSGDLGRWGTWWGKVLASGGGGPTEFANSATITVNDSGSPPTAASPYPSGITVSSLSGVITKLAVKLNGFQHNSPDDVDLLLAGPTGANAIVFSDVGGTTAASGLAVQLDDLAPSALPDSTALLSGSFLPTNVGAGDSFPSPAPAPQAGADLIRFYGTNPNGTWDLFAVDDATTNSGSLASGWALAVTVGSAFSNATTITINDSGSPPTSATPYPSTITVTGLSGVVSKVRVILRGFSHTVPSDVDVLLVGPTGGNAILLSDACGATNPAGSTLLFDDEAGRVVDSSNCTATAAVHSFDYTSSGTDTFGSPAPAPSGNTSIAIFNGTDPNGIWSLYVVDDEAGDSGQVSGGWTLLIETQTVPGSAKKRRSQITSE